MKAVQYGIGDRFYPSFQPVAMKRPGIPTLAGMPQAVDSVRFGASGTRVLPAERQQQPDQLSKLITIGLLLAATLLGFAATLGLVVLIPLSLLVAALGAKLTREPHTPPAQERPDQSELDGPMRSAPAASVHRPDSPVIAPSVRERVPVQCETLQAPVWPLNKTLGFASNSRFRQLIPSLAALNKALDMPEDNHNFAGLTMKGVSFKDIQFPKGTDFRQMYLEGDVEFRNCKLPNANFEGLHGPGKVKLFNTELFGPSVDLTEPHFKVSGR